MLFEMLLSLEKQYSKKLAKLHFVKKYVFCQRNCLQEMGKYDMIKMQDDIFIDKKRGYNERRSTKPFDDSM